MTALSAQPPKRMPITCSLDLEMAERKLTANALAAAIGVAESSLSKLRRNQFSMIDAKNLEKLCAHFGCQPGDLLHYQADG
jgi:putative transcriptional regulator